MPLDTIQAIKTRYSCRAFSDKMPSDENLRIIADAAAASPSEMNRQLWRIIIVKNKDLLSDLESEGMKNLEALPDKSMYERITSRGGNENAHRQARRTDAKTACGAKRGAFQYRAYRPQIAAASA